MKLLAICLSTVGCLLGAGNDTVTITSAPPGATVSWNRRVIGVTPLVVPLGEYAFNPHKSSVFSKRLDQPVVLRIALDGYASQELTITRELTWTSRDQKNHYVYHIIERQDYNFRLDKVASGPRALTNQDILDLSRAGFADEVLVDKINNSATAFQLEVSDMVALRKAGISDAVIQAMVHKGTQP